MQDQDKSSSEKVSKRPQKPEQAPNGKKTSFGTILGVAAIAVAGFSLYQVKTLAPQVEKVATLRGEASARVQQDLTQTQAVLTNIQTQFKAQQQTQDEQENALQVLTEQVQAVKASGQTEDNRWVIKQAIFLIQLAHLNQQFGHDKEQTIASLSAADEQIKSLNDPALIKVRQSLADDISLLKAQPVIDKAGLLAQLSALTKQAEQLVLRTPIKANDIALAQQESTQTETTSKWRQAWKQTLATLQKIVIIRHQQQPVQAVMGPLQHELLLRTIAYQLQQAQWALLQEDIGVYQQSLQQASGAVKDNFDTSKPQTQSFLAELDRLQKIELRVEKAKIQTSLKALKDYLVQHTTKPSVNSGRKQ